MVALAFHHRWSCLLKHVIKKQMPLGKIQDYFLRIEFQSRGSSHLHIFIWSDLGVNFQTVHSFDVVYIIDKTICTQLPKKDTDPDM